MSKLAAYKKMIDYDFSFKKTLGHSAKIFTPNRKEEQLLSSFKEADVVVLGLENIIASCEDVQELKTKIKNINWAHNVTLVEDYNEELMTASQTVFISPFRSIIRSKNKQALSLISDVVIKERIKIEYGEKLLFDILSCDDEGFVSRVAPILKEMIKHPPSSLNITSLLIELDSNQVGLSSVVNMYNILKDVVKASFTATPLSPTTTTFMLKSKVGLETNYFSAKEKHFFDYLDSSLSHAVSYLEKRVEDKSIYSAEVLKELYAGLSNRLYNKGPSFFESKAFFSIQNRIVDVVENFNGYDKNKAFLEECRLKLLCRKFNQPENSFGKFTGVDLGQDIYLNIVDKSLKPSQIEGLVPFFKKMQLESSDLYFRVFYKLFKNSEKTISDSPLSRKIRKGEATIEELVLQKMNDFITEIPLDFNRFVSFIEKEPSLFNGKDGKKKDLIFFENLSNCYFKNKIAPSSFLIDFKQRF